MQERIRKWDRFGKLIDQVPFIPSTEISKNFKEDLFSMSAKLAKADGRICENEIGLVSDLISEQLKYSAKRKKEAKEVFKLAKDSRIPFEVHAHNFYSNFKSTNSLIFDTVDFLLELAYSDSKFCDAEERLLYSTVRIFEIDHLVFRKLQQPHHLCLANQLNSTSVVKINEVRSETRYKTVEVFSKAVRDLYALVDSDPSDSIETIRVNYQRIMAEARPSNLSLKNASSERAYQAQERYVLATKAYKQILKDSKQS